MKRILLAACVFGLSVSDLSAAVVNGKVMFLTKRGQRPVVNETLVWLDPAGRAPKRPGAPFTMTTRSKAFLPHILAVPAGSTISFPNEDPISHNLFSLTPGHTFDLGLYRKGASKEIRFERPGLVRLFCNIHAQMAAYVMVLDGGGALVSVMADKSQVAQALALMERYTTEDLAVLAGA